MEPEYRIKATLDLWIHQNELMLGRLQWLVVIQASMFGAASTVSKWFITVGLFVAAFVGTLALRHVTNVDRVIRNKHRDYLVKNGIPIGLNWDDPEDVERYKEVSLESLKPLDASFYLNGTFIVALGFDLVAFGQPRLFSVLVKLGHYPRSVGRTPAPVGAGRVLTTRGISSMLES